MTTQGANTAHSIIAGFSKLNFSKKSEVKGKQTPSPRRRKLSQTLPTLDESLTASMFSSETFSLEYDPANKPQVNSFDQSQNTLATVDCSESSEFFSYHSDGEEEEDISIREIPPPSSPVPANRTFDYTGIQTPECFNAFDFVYWYPGSPLAKRRRRPILPQHVQLSALEALPGPPLTA